MEIESFNNPENWLGTYYELAIQVSASADNLKLTKAFDCLCKYPDFMGPWLSKKDFPEKIGNLMVSETVSCYGLLKTPSAIELGCVLWIVREKQ
jgi:hypothetical protein